MRSWLSANSSRAAGIYGQLLSSLVTLGQTVIYARTMQDTEFGLFAMATSALLTSHILHRNIVVIPMIVAQAEHRATALRPWVRINTATVALSLALIAVVALVAWWLDLASRVVLPLCAATAVALPSALIYEFARRTLYLEQRYAGAVRMAAINFVLQYAGIAFVVFIGAGALIAMATAGIATGLAAASVRSLLRIEDRAANPSSMALLVKYRSDIAWNIAAAVPYGAFNTGLPMLLGFVANPSTAGLFSATRLLLAPITALVGAVDMVDKPRAARGLREGGRSGLLGSLRYTLTSLLTLSGAYLLLGGFFADQILGLLYGAKAALKPGAAWLWMVVGLFMMFGQVTETGLLVLRRTRWFFWSRFAAMSIGIAVLVVAVPWADYVAGIFSMGAAWLVSGALAALLLGVALRGLPAANM